jgi:hypothetical protein
VSCSVVLTRIIVQGFAVLTAKGITGLPLSDNTSEVATTTHYSTLLRDSLLLTAGSSDSRYRP